MSLQLLDVHVIKHYMEIRGMDAKALSEKMGIGLPSVKRFLDGCDQKNLSANYIDKVAEALNVPVMMIIHLNYQ